MGVAIRGHGTLARRVALALAIPALTLALALGGCRAGARDGGNNNTGGNNPPVTQSASGTGSSSAPGASGTGNNAALQQLENADSQNQSDQQQLNSASSNASVDYSSQDNPVNP